MLITGGNAYALPYADQIVNVPMESSHFNIVDETVPFYQMVIHGSIDYAGSPINLHDEQDMPLPSAPSRRVWRRAAFPVVL